MKFAILPHMNVIKIVPLYCLAILLCCQLWGLGTPTAASETSSAETAISPTTNSINCPKPSTNLPKDIAHIKEHQHEILEDLNNRIKEHTEVGDNYFQRAFIFYHLNKYKEASKDLDQALTLGLNNSRIHLLKSEILFAQKNYNGALEETNKSIELSTKHHCAKPYALLAQIHNNLKNYAEGLKNISKAIELTPQNPRYYEIRADLDYKVEQFGRCIEDASQAIALNPKSKTAYSIRSQAYLANNELEKAKLDAQEAKELPKDLTEPY